MTGFGLSLIEACVLAAARCAGGAVERPGALWWAGELRVPTEGVGPLRERGMLEAVHWDRQGAPDRLELTLRGQDALAEAEALVSAAAEADA